MADSIRRPTRSEHDEVVLALAEKHGLDFENALREKFPTDLERQLYKSSADQLAIEELMARNSDGRLHLTATGRQHLHNIRFQAYLKDQLGLLQTQLGLLKTQLKVAIAAVVFGALIQVADIVVGLREEPTTASAATTSETPTTPSD